MASMDTKSAGNVSESCNDLFTVDENEENITELQEDWGDEYNEVVTLLCGLHLNPYVDMFVRQGINLDIFLNLTEEDLCHIGMTNSKHRNALLQGISMLKKNKVDKSKDGDSIELSAEEVETIMKNTVKQLTVMHASLAHTRLSLRKPSVHNSLVSMTMTAAELLERLTKEARIQAQLVSDQATTILDKKPDESKKTIKTRWKHGLVVISGIGVVCTIFICWRKRPLSLLSSNLSRFSLL